MSEVPLLSNQGGTYFRSRYIDYGVSNMESTCTAWSLVIRAMPFSLNYYNDNWDIPFIRTSSGYSRWVAAKDSYNFSGPKNEFLASKTFMSTNTSVEWERTENDLYRPELDEDTVSQPYVSPGVIVESIDVLVIVDSDAQAAPTRFSIWQPQGSSAETGTIATVEEPNLVTIQYGGSFRKRFYPRTAEGYDWTRINTEGPISDAMVNTGAWDSCWGKARISDANIALDKYLPNWDIALYTRLRQGYTRKVRFQITWNIAFFDEWVVKFRSPITSL